ncbi:hypothetical protein, partial [Pseudomonas putida]
AMKAHAEVLIIPALSQRKAAPTGAMVRSRSTKQMACPSAGMPVYPSLHPKMCKASGLYFSDFSRSLRIPEG